MSKFVIQIENRQAVGHPLLYSNFIQITGCPIQETPTNDVVGPYGYEVFERSPRPEVGVFEHPAIQKEIYICRPDGVWTDTWEITPFNEQEIAERIEKEWIILRRKRTSLLRATDWTQLTDTGLTESDILVWRNFRQTLRDLPANTTDPFNPTWPVPPSPIQSFPFI